jgi:hypothetical protein
MLLLATVGGDGEVKLWSGSALVQATLALGAPAKGKKSKKEAASTAAAAPPVLVGMLHTVKSLATLKAAVGTRPTCAVGTASEAL